MNAILIGGGMITHDQILPSFLQMARQGEIGAIQVCARHAETLGRLTHSGTLREAFPDCWFETSTEPYAQILQKAGPGNIAVIALPDQLHFEATMAALEAGQHAIVVKPLVLNRAQAQEIETTALARGLFVGVEYHKRFDDRSLLARRRYRAGRFGEFRLGSAVLMEKWYYRSSNFQNWCTVENSDAFTYIGCHYADLVHFITGLQPVAVSVYGTKDRYPNGNEGFLWTDARILWENGACLNIQNSLSYPDAAPGTNTQGMTLYCGGGEAGGLIQHSDQYRGLSYAYLEAGNEPGATTYAEPSPDYFQYVERGGAGLTPVGYGLRSFEYLAACCRRVRDAAYPAEEIRAIDAEGIVATPANSRYNEALIEAARESILDGGRQVSIPR